MTPRARLVVVAPFVATAMFVAIVVVDAWPYAEEALIPESSPIAWLQSALLVAGALLALLLVVDDAVWTIAAAGLAAMALDERFLAHERLKERILFSVYGGDLDRMGVVGDLPVLAYPIAGAVGLRVLWSRFDVVARRFAIAAVAFGAGAMLLDVFAHPRVWQALEEVVELYADVCGVAALLVTCSRRSHR